MYENLTYGDILKRMLERVPANLDKREGSVIYDALAPAAMELRLMYLAIDEALEDTFADTASRASLIRRAAERGLAPKPAAYAELLARAVPGDVDVPLGTRFSLNGIYFFVTGKTDGCYKIKCETPGAVGNSFSGVMTPVEYVPGLESFSAAELLIPGEDEEDTEAFRARYLDSFESHAFGGNVDDYIQKTGAIPGVGAVKVTPVWNGGGTVKLTILDSEFNAASGELIDRVQNLIDPEPAMGEGLAPIGHAVTVDAPVERAVDVEFVPVFDEGYGAARLSGAIESVIADYLLELRRGWAAGNGITVRISQIESRIMSVPGVLDISGTLVCGSAENLELPKDQIPVLGVISCE